VVVWATKAELLSLAQRADVDLIESNFRATLIEEVDRAYTGSPTLGIGVTNSLRAINADRVWNELGITGAGTIVANLDTGVEGTHPALSARWRGNTEPASECWRDALGGGTTFPQDSNGHGTHTMGTMCGLGAATGDTVGVAPGAVWIADNAINQGVGSAFDNDVVDAFQWFANPDGNVNTTDDVPDVVQNSWGIDARFGGGYQDCDARWQTVILNCEAAGVVVTFSAGNEGPGAQTHRSPANIATTPTTNFSVGAVDAENFGFPYPIASFSSRGPSDCDGTSIKPEVSAPGVSVYSSYVGGGYARLSGTSMAGPHVAGVVALMRQANPNADVQTIKTALMNTARDEGTAGEDNTYGWGVIDAYAAVQAVMGPDVTPPTVTVVAPNGGETLNAGGTFNILWNGSDNVSVSQSALSYSTNGGTTFAPIVTLPGSPGTYAWTVPNTPTTQGLVRVVCTDPSGNTGSDASNAFFTITSTPGPYVWVQNITLQLVVKGPWTNARATVTIFNQNNQPVANATVSSAWGGLTTDADVFTTKANGTGTCNSDKLRNPSGCWTYAVQNVTVAGHTFRNDLGEVNDTICTSGPTATLSALVAGVPADTQREFQLSVPAPARVTLMIYNVMGRRVRMLADGDLPAGSQTLIWDLKDDRGMPLPSGVYLYRAVAGNEVVTRKVVLVR
jgi:subtilisin family serine protease